MASPHLRGPMHQGNKPPNAFEAAKSKVEQGQPSSHSAHAPGSGVGEGHAKEHGTQPHPVTKVHAVHIHSMGGGKAATHTHHDDGRIETQQHGSMDEAHQHAQTQLPGDGQDQDQDQNQDAMMSEPGTSADDGMASSIGNMG